MIGGSLLAFSGCKVVYLQAKSEEGTKLVLDKAKVDEEKFVVVRAKNTGAPLYVHQAKENQYIALLMVCTHKGCEVEPKGKKLICPCHGGEFSNTGKVLVAPPKSDLKRFPVKIEANELHIDLR